MRKINRLSAVEVEKKTKRGRYGDGGGLWLQVSKYGTKAWIFRFMINRKPYEMGLGSLNTFSLKEARERAKKQRQLLAEGKNPIVVRDDEIAETRVDEAKRITFMEAADHYIKAHSAGWKNAKHGGQWKATLEAYAKPFIGDMAVADIETPNVVSVLSPIWTTKNETANRVRQRIEAVLAWATVSGFRQGDNPARWRGHLDQLLSGRVKKVKHHGAMPYTALPGFMERLRGLDSVSARSLEFTVLTAASPTMKP